MTEKLSFAIAFSLEVKGIGLKVEKAIFLLPLFPFLYLALLPSRDFPLTGAGAIREDYQTGG
jgi:hypothetical protein